MKNTSEKYLIFFVVLVSSFICPPILGGVYELFIFGEQELSFFTELGQVSLAFREMRVLCKKINSFLVLAPKAKIVGSEKDLKLILSNGIVLIRCRHKNTWLKFSSKKDKDVRFFTRKCRNTSAESIFVISNNETIVIESVVEFLRKNLCVDPHSDMDPLSCLSVPTIVPTSRRPSRTSFGSASNGPSPEASLYWRR